MPHNTFNTLDSFPLGDGGRGEFYSLPKLKEAGVGNVSKLPVSIRIVLESVLRNVDGKKIAERDVRTLANWQPRAERTDEIPFMVARVLLQRPRSVVIIFPQGVLTPHAAPPFTLERGIEVLAKRSGVNCVPVGLRYAFFEDEQPDLLMEVGPSHPPGPLSSFTTALQEVAAAVMSAQTLNGFKRSA